VVYLLVIIGPHIRVRQETESSGDLGFTFPDIITTRLRQSAGINCKQVSLLLLTLEDLLEVVVICSISFKS
jgi:hypothetical protein